MVKMTGKTQADLDAEAATAEVEREVAEADATVHSKAATAMRLLLVLTKELWPLLPQASRDAIREAMSDEETAAIQAALEKLA